MERKKKIPLLFLLAVLQVSSDRMDTCQHQPDKNLTCHTDYNHSIACAWNSTNESDHTDAACTLHAKRVTTRSGTRSRYNASCQMEPADISNGEIRRCTLYFKTPDRFLSGDILSISLSCDPGKQISTVHFKPSCHIKLNPPVKPDVNLTTVSWFPQLERVKLGRVEKFTSQLQWKREDQSWSDPSVQKEQTKTTTCNKNCEAQLDPDSLVRGETYEARVRVQADAIWAKSVWSDWGPTASWESSIGKIKPTPPAQLGDFVSGILGVAVTGAALALFLGGILFMNDKAIWVYKKIRGQPPPDPGKSFLKDLNFQNWLSPHFTSESLHYSLKTEDIDSVQVITTADDDTLCSKELALLDKMRKESNRIESTSSSFSNPSYSQLCAPPPVTMTTEDSLETRDNDACDSSTGRQDKDESAEKKKEEERIQEMEIVKLLSKGHNNNDHVKVVSDYEMVEKMQVERSRLQSLDSGICSGEEVSQESLEADSINVSESRDEVKGLENKKVVIFQKLFGGNCQSVFGKGSIQVCSDYEQVLKLQPSSPELPSLDSGVSDGGEEQVSHEESLEDTETTTETTNFLFLPTLSSLPCPVPSFPQLLLTLSGTDLGPALQPSNLSEVV